MPSTYTILFISFLTSFFGLKENASDYKLSEYIAPPEVAVCASEFDLDKYREENTNATFTAITNGRWDVGTTWNQGTVPGLNDAVIIPAGRTVRLFGTCSAKNTTVNGTLTYNATTQNFNLLTEWMLVQGTSAKLELGTATNRYLGRGIITLIGTKDNQNIASCGDKFICALGGGTIRMHGVNTISWTQLGANAPAGANSITLKEAVTWPIGAEILVVSSRTNWNEAEKRTITAKSANNRTLTLNSALTYPHTGIQKTYTRPSPAKTWTADLRAEVGLLSKNLTIKGDAGAAATGFGGHIMVHYGCKAYIDGVELFRMGQKAELGRYPFHWHLVKNGGVGQYLKNTSIHTSYNRAVTIHGTESALVEGNFCYDHLGHGIFLEDGGERFNVIRKNVVLLTKRPAAGEELTPSDNELNQVQNRTPSSFWITNPNNIFEDNVAAGTHGTGYWFIFPQSPMGDSSNDPYFSGQQPHKQPLGSFKGNKAHSCMNGFDIFDQLFSDHSIRTNWGWDNSGLHVMENCTWYANQLGVYAGIGAGGPQDNVIYRNNIFVENQTALFFATYNIVEQSVFVANSGENLATGVKHMYEMYDGAGTVRNSHVIGWTSGTGVNLLRRQGAATKHVNHKFSGITRDNPSASFIIDYPDCSINPPPNVAFNSPLHPRVWNVAIRDLDGSFGGAANTTIVSNHPLMLTGGEYQAPNWSNIYRSTHKFGLVWLWYPGVAMPNFPNVTMKRTKGSTPEAGVYYTDGYKEKHQLPLIVNEGFTHTYQYEALPTSKRVQVYFEDVDVGDEVLLVFKDFGKLGGFAFPGVTVHGSLANLLASNTTGYYRQTNGDLYFRPKAIIKKQSWTMSWSTNFAVPVLDTDGDGSTDSFEAKHYRNPIDVKDFGFQYNDNGDFEGWTLNSISAGAVNGGTLKGTASTNDPKVIKTNGFNFQASEFQNILVRMKSTLNRNAQLFWGRVGAPGYAGTRVRTDTYNANGDWQVLVFEVGTHAEWINTIRDIRLDPTSSPAANFEIDWIVGSDGDIDDDGIPDGTDDCITFSPTLNFPGVVPTGLHQANVNITSNGTVPAGTGTTFESGVVEMTLGFDAQLNSNFEAKIGCQ